MDATQALIDYLSSTTVKQRISLDELAHGTNMERSELDDVLLDALANGIVRGKLDLKTDTLAIMDFQPRTPMREDLPALIDILEAFKRNLDREQNRLDRAIQTDATGFVEGLSTDSDYVDKQFVDMIQHCQPRPDPFLDLFTKMQEGESSSVDRASLVDRGEDKTALGKMARKAKELGRRFMGGDV